MKSYKIILALLIVTNIYYFNSYGIKPEENQTNSDKAIIQLEISQLNSLVSRIKCADKSEKQRLIDEANANYFSIMENIKKNIPVTESIKFTHELSKIQHRI